MDLVTVFYSPMILLIALPYLALVPALLFGRAYRASGRPRAKGALVAAILWALYGLYEGYMFFWSRTVVAPIRVDLLLLAPVLYLATATGILSWRRSVRQHPGGSGV